MKKLLVFLFMVLSLGFSFSFSGSVNNGICGEYKKLFTIDGHSITKNGVSESYKIKGIKNINWDVIKKEKIVLTKDDKDFEHSFVIPGNILLEGHFKYSGCNIVLKKEISIYKTIILSLNNKDVDFIGALNLKKKNIYIKNIPLKNLKQYNYILNESDYILVNQEFIIPFLSKFMSNINYKNKKIVLFIGSFKGFYAKLLIPYTRTLSKNIYIYDKNNLLNVVSSIYQGKKLDNKNSLYNRNIGNNFYFPLSYFVGKLISVGVNIEIIGIILLSILGIIIVSFLRQIIGFSIFGLYTPLLLSILILIYGYHAVIILFVISVFSTLINNFITKRIYILYSSKIALNYMIYTVLSIIFLGILISLGYINNIHIDMNWVILFFVIPLLTKNLIKEDTNIFSKSFMYLFTEFIVILLILLSIYNITYLKYILVAYPDLLWLFIPITIFIGRFTGLQLLEYIRFYPLIKKNIYEEE